MNFYDHQARARQRTGLLVGYFALAVLMIALALNVVVYFAATGAAGEPLPLADWLNQPYWQLVSVGVVILIAGGSIVTLLRLSGGGQALAAMVGARELDFDTRDIKERQLINVVEEMSIASGTPVPALYVLEDEPGINAFVAGTRPSETVMVVTRGALDHFTRDELQGVVAHEYSHIFNNDMSINIRLMGVLAGILVIGQIGRFMLRSGSHSRSKNSGQLMAAGVAVLVIGYVGLFFGALIKAAISRQREFLADASAVQFTRNPDGIAGALMRIQRHVEGSALNNSHSEDLSHFCFGESVSYFFAGLMATHPPLEDRVRAIDPHAELKAESLAADQAGDDPTAGIATAGAAGFAGAAAAPTPAGVAAAVADSVGTVNAAQLALAGTLEHAIERDFADVHTANGAQRALVAMLTHASPQAARGRIDELVRRHSADLADGLEASIAAVTRLPDHGRFALLNVLMRTLKSLSREEKPRVLALVRQIIDADGEFSIYEFCVHTILVDQLRVDAARPPPVTMTMMSAAEPALARVLSVLADAGTENASAAAAAFDAAADTLGLPALAKVASAKIDTEQLVGALTELAGLSPILKHDFIRACAACVVHDGRVASGEGEVLQVIALKLDCPMPPLIAAGWVV